MPSKNLTDTQNSSHQSRAHRYPVQGTHWPAGSSKQKGQGLHRTLGALPGGVGCARWAPCTLALRRYPHPHPHEATWHEGQKPVSHKQLQMIPSPPSLSPYGAPQSHP